MWVKCLWVCLISGVVVATLQEVPPAPIVSWSRVNPRYLPVKARQSLPEIYQELLGDKRSPLPSTLSVSNSIEVLRNRLLLEIARRRLNKQDESQILANREFMKQVGKRTLEQDKAENLDYYNNVGDIDWDSS